ncbi:PhoH family protein [bacterium]|nr:PhoH family protein [bacterium]
MTAKKGSKRTKSVASSGEIEKALADNTNNFSFHFKKREFKFTEKQRSLIDIITNQDTNIVLLNGPAGTSKTMIALYSALLMMKEEKIESIMYLRSVVESAQKSMGFLKGDVDDKMSYFTAIIDDKMMELVRPEYLPLFKVNNRVETMPLNYVRGCSWRNKFILADELQNFSKKEILSTMTRIGKGSVMVMAGDPTQSDINNSGFQEVFDMFDDEESQEKGIFTFKFTEKDIVRSEIVKYIVDKFQRG